MMTSKRVLLSVPFLLLTFLFMTQSGYSQSSLAVTPTPAVTVAAELDAPPADCGVLADAMAIDPLIPDALGAWPIWVALPNRGPETKGIVGMPNQHFITNPQLEGWWATKIAWFIATSYVGEVRLQGFNTADHSPMYFEFDGDEATTLATLNPEHPGGSANGLANWAFFPSYMWVSKAGCYRLEAEWDGGLWQQIIAVGSME